ncbi:hypothetical protein TPHA_0J02450 [Tetrapisispora phaffii CBS 4417]|uniref:Uncharacterized protein n=1 Tax=Tetrapisispora phaffii (strain ATCC 24235 / CBS 4417 / NBRC 1672 / NRRL Y-8282 / UCD 70-5) TaxID=1071381 RepID=G8BYX3_TETPH|nr:hypothetical protein TPHA_0J02450 [Tetrapisispora phaffii CBS 4417]CCE65065.1 hypothetical protein TPHA_0J02450 [Tetrapisispora phaffii CBS 4417]
MRRNSPEQHTRRANAKRVNYNEKDADFELLQRIQKLEKGLTKKNGKKPSPKPTKSKSNENNKSSTNLNRKEYYKVLNDKKNWNFIPTLPTIIKKHSRFSQLLYLDDAMVDTENQILSNKDGKLLSKNETIYMVSEPPGEPYYIGRIVCFEPLAEFKNEIKSAQKNNIRKFPAKYFNLRMNWFYRPRDIEENWSNSDPRLLYASLHEDVCPIISFRGKCNVYFSPNLVLDTAEDKENVAKIFTNPNNFHFEQLFDKYTSLYYTIWDVSNLLHMHPKSAFLKALSKRFKYLFTEDKYPLEEILKKYVISEGNINVDEDNKKNRWDMRCTECKGWCQATKGIKCDDCGVAIHLVCMDPPRDRKPNKGVIWLCYNCALKDNDDDTLIDCANKENINNKLLIDQGKAKLSEIANDYLKTKLAYNVENIWFQYIGEDLINNIQDVLDPDIFLPYPFKLSRVGPRYQWSKCLDMNTWEKTPYSISDAQTLNGETIKSDKNNVMERGTNSTVELLWKYDESKITEEVFNNYIEKCKSEFPVALNILPQSVNFLDMISHILMENNFDVDNAFEQCKLALTRESLREPSFTKKEMLKFEEAVKEHGSELFHVCKKVETQPMSMIVRYYYYWKKTQNGRQIWGSFKGRAKNKNKAINNKDEVNRKLISTNSDGTGKPESRPVRNRKSSRVVLENKKQISTNDLEMKYIDDSSIETENVSSLKSCFHCIFCNIDYSPIWYKVTGGSDDANIKTKIQTNFGDKTQKGKRDSTNSESTCNEESKLDALCIRCTRLWRRYAVKWENPLTILRIMYGKNNSNILAAFDGILTEHPNNLFFSNPLLSREKLLEYELVQDSELILKQKVDILNDEEKLQKIIKTTMSVHSQLFKALKRPHVKGSTDNKILTLELNEYIDTNMKKILKKKKKEDDKENKNDRLGELKKGKPLIEVQIKQEQLNKRKPEASQVENERPIKVKKTLATVHNIVNKYQELLDLNTKYGHKLTSNNGIEVNLSSKNDNTGYTISVSPEFRNIQINNSLHQHLNSLLSENVISRNNLQIGKNNLDLNSNKKLSKSKKTTFLPFNNSSEPSIFNGSDISSIMKFYHCYNPSFTESNTRYLNSVENMKNQHNNETSSGLSNDLNKTCSICNLHDNNNVLLECSNCTLLIHAKCYGVKVNGHFGNDDSTKGYTWLCDPCSNDLNPIISTSYKCGICSSKETLSGGQKLYPGYTPQQALKATSNGTWCHVICALYGKEIKFGNSESLQPVLNATSIMHGEFNKCGICQGIGGVIEACMVCNYNAHVTCAQWSKRFKLGFQYAICDGSTETTPIIHNSSNKEQFLLRPKMVCKVHPHQKELLDFNHQLERHKKTLFEVFVERYKIMSNHSVVQARYQEQKKLLQGSIHCDSDVSMVKRDRVYSMDNSSTTCQMTKANNKVCKHCLTTRSICWYANSICHSCHVNSNNGKFIAKQSIFDFDINDHQAESNYLSNESKQALLDSVKLLNDN